MLKKLKNLKNLPKSLRLLLSNFWSWLLEGVYDLRAAWGKLEEENARHLVLQKEYVERIDFLQREVIQLRGQNSKLESEKNRYQDEHLEDLRRVADRFCINSTGKSLFGVINPVEENEGIERPEVTPFGARTIHGAELKHRVMEFRRKQKIEQDKLEMANHGG